MERLLRYEETAKRLNVKVSTLYSWVRDGRIPHIRLGPRCIRFDEVEIDRWVREKKVAEPAVPKRVPTKEAWKWSCED
mgnify:CR=1 FL=1|tara:strand:- start:1090 stop:1323 length:234 start_codon:yes stop_codon:yes gene_type:complete